VRGKCKKRFLLANTSATSSVSVQFVTRSAGPCLHRREPSALVLAAATPPLHAGPCCQSELPSFRRWYPTRGLLARSRALWLSFSMLMVGSGCWSSPRKAHSRLMGTTSARRVAPACEDTLRVETKATRCWRRCSKSCTSPESRRVTGPEFVFCWRCESAQNSVLHTHQR
jgi:hypothetical protein